jgi:kynurenine formamidase
MNWILSYPVSQQAPLYPGTPPVSVTAVKSIERGDSATTSLVTVSTHAGTHIDAPRHFCPEGMTTRDILGRCREVAPVYCIDLDVTTNRSIGPTDIRPHAGEIADAEGLFLRTGMFRFRNSDRERYCTGHPWIHPDLPAFLRKTCPSLLLFGTDTISISNPAHREEGRACHRAFLCGSDPIILAEDLDLSEPALAGRRIQVTICPWTDADLDGVPVIVFATSEEGTRRGRETGQ